MKVFLNGGGCGTQTVETYKEINKIIDHNKSVLYVPLAMDENEHPYDSCYEWIKGEIEIIDVPRIDMVRTFDELAEKDYNNYSMIYLGGGNTFKLLNGIKENNIFNKIKTYINNDGIVYGSSAGSVIFGKDINVIDVMDKNTINLKDTKGFDLLNGKSLFVHYINYKSRYTEEENKMLIEKYTKFLIDYTINNENVIAYPEENTIFIDGDNIKMIGKSSYYTFNDGIKEKIDIE